MASQFKTFTAGSVLTASEMNTYLMKQAVIVCDSTADYPSSPVEGMTIYDKGADKLLTYTTATTTWKAPWNMSWGVVAATAGGTSGYGYVRATSAIGVSGTNDITGLTVTFNAVANRLYQIVGAAAGTHSTASTLGTLILDIDGSSAGGCNLILNTAGAGNDRHFVIDQLTTLSTGSHTVKLRGSSASGTLTFQGSTSQPIVLSVVDIGPVGGPA